MITRQQFCEIVTIIEEELKNKEQSPYKIAEKICDSVEKELAIPTTTVVSGPTVKGNKASVNPPKGFGYFNNKGKWIPEGRKLSCEAVK